VPGPLFRHCGGWFIPESAHRQCRAGHGREGIGSRRSRIVSRFRGGFTRARCGFEGWWKSDSEVRQRRCAIQQLASREVAAKVLRLDDPPRDVREIRKLREDRSGRITHAEEIAGDDAGSGWPLVVP
jgi:hypothetical protein